MKEVTAFIFLAFSVFSDLKSKKIANNLLVGMILLGLLVQVGSAGLSGLWLSISSFLAAFAIGLPFYLMRMYGGGDFKLLMAVSVLLHWQIVLVMILTSFFWGAALGVFQSLLKGEFKVLVANIFSVVKRQNVSAQSLHMIPFSVAILFGFLTALTLNRLGVPFL